MQWLKIFSGMEAACEKLIENKPQLVIAGGKRIALVRQGTTIYAVSDTCTHNGESLSKGKVNHACEIVCPWHGYIFNLKTGREYQQRSNDLECFPLKEEADGLYIGV
jgi:nitrite reductase/ring-hydroxylating ferredoxin subunit